MRLYSDQPRRIIKHPTIAQDKTDREACSNDSITNATDAMGQKVDLSINRSRAWTAQSAAIRYTLVRALLC